MANEFVTKKFLDATGVKVLWDEVAAEIKVEADRAKAEEANLAAAIAAEATARENGDAAEAAKIATLTGVVEGVSANVETNAADIKTLQGQVGALIEGTYDDSEVRGLIADNAQAIVDEKARAEAAEAKALEDAKAYTDEVKASILGEDLTDTYDTLKEIADWIDTHGVQATELAGALAAETEARVKGDEDEAALRAAADTALDGRITALEAVDVATKADVAAAKAEAIADAEDKVNAAIETAAADATAKANAAQAAAEATAAADATTKANAAETAAKAHAEEKATAAKDAAIAAAALDATAKADQAELDAITAAATDATQKANTAEANAKAYADKAYAAIDALSAAEIRTAIGRTTE